MKRLLIFLVFLFSGCTMSQQTQEISKILLPGEIYKIVLPEDFNQSVIKPTALGKSSGFIHAAHGYSQVIKVLSRFFDAQSKVLILELNQDELKNKNFEIRMEQNKPGGDTYPHIYGQGDIPGCVVKKVFTAVKRENNQWVIIKN
jgi:uncharacterized protein (DUF952 family)